MDPTEFFLTPANKQAFGDLIAFREKEIGYV